MNGAIWNAVSVTQHVETVVLVAYCDRDGVIHSLSRVTRDGHDLSEVRQQPLRILLGPVRIESHAGVQGAPFDMRNFHSDDGVVLIALRLCAPWP